MGYGAHGGPPPMQTYNSHHDRLVQSPGMNANSGPRTMPPFIGPGPGNGRRSLSLPPGASYPHGAMDGVGPYVEPEMQNGVVAGPSNSNRLQQHPSSASANGSGWNKEYNDKQRVRDSRRERK